VVVGRLVGTFEPALVIVTMAQAISASAKTNTIAPSQPAGRSTGSNGKGASQLSVSPAVTASPHASGGRMRTWAGSAESSMASIAAQRLNDRRGESRGMARVRRSYEVAIDDDRRILHPGCTGGFSVGLHDQFGVRRAVIEPRHAAAGNDPRTGGQHR